MLKVTVKRFMKGLHDGGEIYAPAPYENVLIAYLVAIHAIQVKVTGTMLSPVMRINTLVSRSATRDLRTDTVVDLIVSKAIDEKQLELSVDAPLFSCALRFRDLMNRHYPNSIRTVGLSDGGIRIYAETDAGKYGFNAPQFSKST